MKKRYCRSWLIPLILQLALTGCGPAAETAAVPEDSVSKTAAAPETDGAETVTETDGEETEPEVIPDPSKITLTIEDFNGITDAKSSLSMPDLSAFGVAEPDVSFEEEPAREGKALVATLKAASYCQVYEITGSRLGGFAGAKPEYYLRVWVAAPESCGLGLTFCIGSQNASRRSYLNAGRAVLTCADGRVAETVTGNDTNDAGENSSLRVPAGFVGYAAVPLDGSAPWRGFDGVTDLCGVDYLKIDARPAAAVPGDRYALDDLCISDSPAAELYPGRAGADTDGGFASKREEAERMIHELLEKEADFRYCPEYDPKGYPKVKALWMNGVKFGDSDTKVFAYIGFPEGADASSPVPAVVLHHGGGGFAYPNWVKMWNDRGYAAIAVGNTGYYPVKEGITDYYSPSSWTRSVPESVLSADPRIMPPDNDGMYTSAGRVDRMWMYHAVAQTVAANNILRADPRVDKDRIGITGISWGGVITAAAIGFDTRFAFAVPVYGSAYLNEAHSWIADNFNSAGAKELWEPSLRLKNFKSPVLWLCWADDNCFSVNSNSRSLLESEKGTLSVIQGMGHGHIEGWSREEIYRFADHAVKGGEPLASPVTLPGKGADISFRVNVPADAESLSARVCWIDAPLSYSENGRLRISGQATIDQEWHFTGCTVNGGEITARLPDGAYSYYVEISVKCGGRTYITSTPLTDVG